MLPVEQRPAWSLRDLASTFYVAPHASPDFVWTFVSRFLFVLAYALLVTYQAYFLLDEVGSDEADVPRLIFLGTLASSVLTVVASLVSGRLSDRWHRRKPFVCAAALVYAAALSTIAATGGVTGYLVGMAIGGLGFGIYVAVDLALVADVLPDEAEVAKDLGVFNIAGALPFSIGPVVATASPRPERRELRGAVRRGRRLCRGECGCRDPRAAGALTHAGYFTSARSNRRTPTVRGTTSQTAVVTTSCCHCSPLRVVLPKSASWVTLGSIHARTSANHDCFISSSISSGGATKE